MRERSSPSTRNTATCPFSSASAAMRRGSTATPRPRVAAFTSASVLVDSHTGATVKPAAAAALSNCSRVPLPFFAQQKALDAEGVQRHGLALRKGTARRADDGQSIRHIFLRCQRTAVDRPFHQSDVQRVVQQLFLKLLRRPHPDAHIHPGCAARNAST